ncbi:hypothetical protein G4G28_08645 [Massilia sp. Dwa41.01b]|uniref:cohesin domain-containing protein n=1 Tax=Massilia sp. Dwa41.01b TaxID=2709302 RepID=UPI0016039B67|nr:cohesin domain-containing protein [Massilia sp. Dwa41.01b]QNA88540.1 hypothetical protein G4G28_08645 [Massilia sp. Dwa41.01b]
MKAFTKLLLLALSLLLLASHPAQAVPILTLTTDSTSVEQGAEFSIALDVADIADLFGYNVTINYDPAKIRFVSVSEGGFLGSAGTSFFVPGVDDGAGSVAFSGAALIGAIGGANGGGNLLNFVFAGRGRARPCSRCRTCCSSTRPWHRSRSAAPRSAWSCAAHRPRYRSRLRWR